MGKKWIYSGKSFGKLTAGLKKVWECVECGARAREISTREDCEECKRKFINEEHNVQAMLGIL